jgi:hypothetical protein
MLYLIFVIYDCFMINKAQNFILSFSLSLDII